MTLVCWACGKRAGIEVDGPPMFAFEVANWADRIGWYGVIDMRRGRSLVFCCKEHADSQRLKSGAFRARTKAVA